MRKLRNILWRAVPAILCGMTLACSTAPAMPVHAEETEPGVEESAIRYAVRLYGIGVDKVIYIEDFEDDEDEFRAGMGGLTFGPALGRSDITSWTGNENHGGETPSGNAHRCIHYDTWKEIVENNRKDPYIYEECLKEGCTKSVVLKLNGDNSEATSKESTKVFDTTKAKATTGMAPACSSMRSSGPRVIGRTNMTAP